MTKAKQNFQKDKLQVEIYDQKHQMGEAAAEFVSQTLEKAINEKGAANLILATGASQFEFLDALKTKKIEWNKITVFHLDEYKGISIKHPASFRKYLNERILDIVHPKKVFLLNGEGANLQDVLNEYEALLKKHPIDIACIGIGENGHIAFNDPPVADFNDPKLVKVVELDHECRMQQLGEGWFETLDDVPTEAITLTVSAIMNCTTISCVVPDERKSMAVYNTLWGQISTQCPASVLRTHNNVRLFLDTAAASKIEKELV